MAALFGNKTAESILLYLAVNTEAYAQELSQTLHIPLSMVQKQLTKLERGGILAGTHKGRMRFYTFHPRFPLSKELKSLLMGMLQFLSEQERKPFVSKRQRPRMMGKPL